MRQTSLVQTVIRSAFSAAAAADVNAIFAQTCRQYAADGQRRTGTGMKGRRRQSGGGPVAESALRSSNEQQVVKDMRRSATHTDPVNWALINAPTKVFQLIGDPQSGLADDTTVNPFGETTVDLIHENKANTADWFKYDYAGNALRETQRDSRLSDYSKNLMYLLRAKDPKRWSFDALARKFHIRKQRVVAILALKELEAQAIEQGELLSGPLEGYACTVQLEDLQLDPVTAQPRDFFQPQEYLTANSPGSSGGFSSQAQQDELGLDADFLAGPQAAAGQPLGLNSAVSFGLINMVPQVHSTASAVTEQLRQLLASYQYSHSVLVESLRGQVDRVKEFQQQHFEGTGAPLDVERYRTAVDAVAEALRPFFGAPGVELLRRRAQLQQLAQELEPLVLEMQRQAASVQPHAWPSQAALHAPPAAPQLQPPLAPAAADATEGTALAAAHAAEGAEGAAPVLTEAAEGSAAVAPDASEGTAPATANATEAGAADAVEGAAPVLEGAPEGSTPGTPQEDPTVPPPSPAGTPPPPSHSDFNPTAAAADADPEGASEGAAPEAALQALPLSSAKFDDSLSSSASSSSDSDSSSSSDSAGSSSDSEDGEDAPQAAAGATTAGSTSPSGDAPEAGPSGSGREPDGRTDPGGAIAALRAFQEQNPRFAELCSALDALYNASQPEELLSALDTLPVKRQLLLMDAMPHWAKLVQEMGRRHKAATLHSTSGGDASLALPPPPNIFGAIIFEESDIERLLQASAQLQALMAELETAAAAAAGGSVQPPAAEAAAVPAEDVRRLRALWRTYLSVSDAYDDSLQRTTGPWGVAEGSAIKALALKVPRQEQDEQPQEEQPQEEEAAEQPGRAAQRRQHHDARVSRLRSLGYDHLAAYIDYAVVGRVYDRGSGERHFVRLPTFPTFEGYSLDEFDRLGEGELSQLNRLVAQKEEDTMFREFHSNLLFNLGLLGEELQPAMGQARPQRPVDGWSYVVTSRSRSNVAPMPGFEMVAGRMRAVVGPNGERRPLNEQERLLQERRQPKARRRYTP